MYIYKYKYKCRKKKKKKQHIKRLIRDLRSLAPLCTLLSLPGSVNILHHLNFYIFLNRFLCALCLRGQMEVGMAALQFY